MSDFEIITRPIVLADRRRDLEAGSAGAYVAFEGWVRDHHLGRRVQALEYEAYQVLAEAEGRRILSEAREHFGVEKAAAVHRVGLLQVGEVAVWVGVVAAHRREAFAACQYIIDTLKARVPIWKKEFFADGDAQWVACHACGAPPPESSHENSSCKSREVPHGANGRAGPRA